MFWAFLLLVSLGSVLVKLGMMAAMAKLLLLLLKLALVAIVCLWPLVVSCGNQRRQSVVVVAPCGHVGKSQSGLSTCPCGLVVHELEAVS